MTSRRKGANTGNSSPVVTRSYDLRDRTKGKGDVSVLTRSAIKNAGKETKDQPVEKSVKNKSRRKPSRRAAKPVEPDTDNDSEDGSENSEYSMEGSSENDQQSHVTPTKPSSESSAKGQPSQPRHFSKYIDDDKANLSLVRPPIGSSYGSAKKQPYQARQVMEHTEAVTEERHYYKGESWRGSTKTQPSQSSSEDYEEEIIQDQQKPKVNTETQPALSRAHIGFSDDEEELATPHQRKEDQVIERTQHKEEFKTWRAPVYLTDFRGEPVIHNRYHPKVNTETPPALSRSNIGFSDDEEELATPHQQEEVKNVKTRWTSTRDQYRRELGDTLRSGDGAVRKRPDLYTKQLQFLKDVMELRITTDNLEDDPRSLDSDETQITDPSPPVASEQNPTQTDSQTDNPEPPTTSPDETPQYSGSRPAARRRSRNVPVETQPQTRAMIDSQVLDYLKKNDAETEEEIMLRSLAPFLNRVPKERHPQFMSLMNTVLQIFSLPQDPAELVYLVDQYKWRIQGTP